MQNLENEQTLCHTALNKLEALCRENQLTYLFQSDAYPISLTLRPDTSLDGQMSLLEEDRRPPHKNTYIFLQFYWASVKHGFASPTNMPRLTG